MFLYLNFGLFIWSMIMLLLHGSLVGPTSNLLPYPCSRQGPMHMKIDQVVVKLYKGPDHSMNVIDESMDDVIDISDFLDRT